MRRSIHVMLYQDAVLEHGYLRPVAVLPDDHDPLHRLAPGQELGLGDDRRAAAPGVTALPASLPLGFEPRRPRRRRRAAGCASAVPEVPAGCSAVTGPPTAAVSAPVPGSPSGPPASGPAAASGLASSSEPAATARPLPRPRPPRRLLRPVPGLASSSPSRASPAVSSPPGAGAARAPEAGPAADGPPGMASSPEGRETGAVVTSGGWKITSGGWNAGVTAGVLSSPAENGTAIGPAGPAAPAGPVPGPPGSSGCSAGGPAGRITARALRSRPSPAPRRASAA